MFITIIRIVRMNRPLVPFFTISSQVKKAEAQVQSTKPPKECMQPNYRQNFTYSFQIYT